MFILIFIRIIGKIKMYDTIPICLLLFAIVIRLIGISKSIRNHGNGLESRLTSLENTLKQNQFIQIQPPPYIPLQMNTDV